MRQTLTNLRMAATGISRTDDEGLKVVLDERLEASEKKIRSGY